jgi:hypothetical protein
MRGNGFSHDCIHKRCPFVGFERGDWLRIASPPVAIFLSFFPLLKVFPEALPNAGGRALFNAPGCFTAADRAPFCDCGDGRF